jgi:hypothetical protein
MSPRGPALNPQNVEEHWSRRLADAKASYEIAVSRFRTASEDFRSRHTPSPDGGFNVHLAIAAESSARKEYMRVLRVFTDLVVYGKIPDETESRAKPGNGAVPVRFTQKGG